MSLFLENTQNCSNMQRHVPGLMGGDPKELSGVMEMLYGFMHRGLTGDPHLSKLTGPNAKNLYIVS